MLGCVMSVKIREILFCFAIVLGIVMAMADSEGGGSGSHPAVHIVYTEKPQDEPEAYHIRTLATVLGSEEAAKEALLYSYKTAATGFSAKLTPEQVEAISKQPGVIQVIPSMTYHLLSRPMTTI